MSLMEISASGGGPVDIAAQFRELSVAMDGRPLNRAAMPAYRYTAFGWRIQK